MASSAVQCEAKPRLGVTTWASASARLFTHQRGRATFAQKRPHHGKMSTRTRYGSYGALSKNTCNQPWLTDERSGPTIGVNQTRISWNFAGAALAGSTESWDEEEVTFLIVKVSPFRDQSRMRIFLAGSVRRMLTSVGPFT